MPGSYRILLKKTLTWREIKGMIQFETKTLFTVRGQARPRPSRGRARPKLWSILCVYSAGLGRGLNVNLSIFCRSGALHVNKLLFWGAPKPQCRALTSTKVSGAEEPAAHLAPHLALVRLQ